MLELALSSLLLESLSVLGAGAEWNPWGLGLHARETALGSMVSYCLPPLFFFTPQHLSSRGTLLTRNWVHESGVNTKGTLEVQQFWLIPAAANQLGDPTQRLHLPNPLHDAPQPVNSGT